VIEVRAATQEDAAGIAELCNVLSRTLYDTGDVDAVEVREWFDRPELELFAVDQGGHIVGYADVSCDEDGTRFPIDIRAAPSVRGSGATDALLNAAEESARRRAKPGAVLRGYAPERDEELQETYRNRRFALIRHSFFMEVDLPETPEEPVWPEGIAVREYDPGRDEQAAYECSQESFADHWDFHPLPIERWRAYNVESARFEPELWWLAEDGGQLAAVCLNAWHWSGDPAFGWIGTLGVRCPWRKRGLGRALLLHSFADFKRRGATRVGLGVDAENTTGAVRLYESVGMRQVQRNDTYEKPL